MYHVLSTVRACRELTMVTSRFASLTRRICGACFSRPEFSRGARRIRELVLLAIALTLITNHSSLITVHAQDFPKQQVLDVNLNYNNGQVTLTSVNRREGYLPDYLNQPTEGYTLIIFDKDQKEQFRVKFNFPLEIITEDITQGTGSVQTLTEADTTVVAPAHENAQKLEILDPIGAKVLEHNLEVIVDPKLAERGATSPKNNYLIWILAALAALAVGIFTVRKLKSAGPPPPQA